ncbi:MAG: DUF4912 domain-containing protein [Spirochaetales bacterium]|nr:DUF4912 domain-containing protein [Spirochaetales bacterium]
MNVERLNGLSLEALYALAEKMGLDLPAGLERVFVVEAVLEAFDEDNEERRASGDAAIHIEEKKFSGSELDEIDASLDAAPCIVGRYNETVIHCVPRDHEWAFAFWDVRDDEQDLLKAEGGFSGFFLRVVKNPSHDGKGSSGFDIPVEDDDNHWYIHLPEQDTVYRLDLCARFGAKFRPIAHSHAFRTPRSVLTTADDGLEPKQAALAGLSGIDHLMIQNLPDRHPSRILGGFDD